MIDNLQWLKKVETNIIENGGADLYCVIECMYKEKKMNFVQMLYDASKGNGCVVSEGIEYVLDQDLDDPNDFTEVSFLIGDYQSSTISPQHFVELMQVIADSYIEAHPLEKESIEEDMTRLRERYS